MYRGSRIYQAVMAVIALRYEDYEFACDFFVCLFFLFVCRVSIDV